MMSSLSVNTLNELIRLCLQNAERFIKDAELLIDDDSYDHALALTILADEELAKLSIYHVGSLGLIKIYYNGKYVYIYGEKINIKNHKQKQSFQSVLYLFNWCLEPLFEELFEIKKNYKEDIEKDTFIEIMNRHTERILRSTEEGTPEEKEVKRQMDRFNTLEKIKQSALYVDIKDGKTTSPQSITQNMVIDYISEVKRRLNQKKRDINLPMTEEFKNLLNQFKPIFDKKKKG